jgi:hypothetical protein
MRWEGIERRREVLSMLGCDGMGVDEMGWDEVRSVLMLACELSFGYLCRLRRSCDTRLSRLRRLDCGEGLLSRSRLKRRLRLRGVRRRALQWDSGSVRAQGCCASTLANQQGQAKSAQAKSAQVKSSRGGAPQPRPARRCARARPLPAQSRLPSRRARSAPPLQQWLRSPTRPPSLHSPPPEHAPPTAVSRAIHTG